MPLYDSLGENAVEFIIDHSEAVASFCAGSKLPLLAKALALVKGDFKTVIYWGSGDAASLDVSAHAARGTRGARGARQCRRRQEASAQLPAATRAPADLPPPPPPRPQQTTAQAIKAKGIAVLSFDEIMEKGKAAPVEPVAPKAEDICTIMYTSGTTGGCSSSSALHRPPHPPPPSPLAPALLTARIALLQRHELWCVPMFPRPP